MDRVETNPNVRRDRTPMDVKPDAVLHWRLYYSDGTFVGSHQMTWEQAPDKHIVAVVQALDDEPASVELGTRYYWHFGDWIARIWDPTLYLRQTGQVKFGRWTKHATFSAAWRDALKRISVKVNLADDEGASRAGVCSSTRPAKAGETGGGWALWYDDMSYVTSEQTTWEKAPSDGVLCAVYWRVYSGLVTSYAMRRYTHYLWQGGELQNTDDFDAVLRQFPQVKCGQPSFEGGCYLHHGEAIAAAFRDTLEDVRNVATDEQ